jgi:hypothetical protein
MLAAEHPEYRAGLSISEQRWNAVPRLHVKPKEKLGDALGRLIELTDDERDHLKRWRLYPIDATKQALQQRVERRRKAGRKRKRADKRQAIIKALGNEDDADVLAAVRRLRQKNCGTYLPTVPAIVRSLRAQRGAAVSRQRVHEAIRRLQAAGLVQVAHARQPGRPLIITPADDALQASKPLSGIPPENTPPEAGKYPA